MKNYKNFLLEKTNRYSNTISFSGLSVYYDNDEIEIIITKIKSTYDIVDLDFNYLKFYFLDYDTEISDLKKLKDFDFEIPYTKKTNNFHHVNNTNYGIFVGRLFKTIPGNEYTDNKQLSIFKPENNYVPKTISLFIKEKDCREKIKNKNNHGKKYEIDLINNINMYKKDSIKLMSSTTDKWDAVGNIDQNYINSLIKNGDEIFFKEDKITDDKVKSFFKTYDFYKESDTYFWNIKNMSKNNQITLSDFLRIAGLEKDKDNEIVFMKKESNDAFMFAIAFHENQKILEENYIIMPYDYWVNILPQRHNLTDKNIVIETITKMYDELQGFKYDSEKIIKNYLNSEKKIKNINGENFENINKTDLDGVLDKLLSGKEWSIDFVGDENGINGNNDVSWTKYKKENESTSQTNDYLKWKKNKQDEWREWSSKQKEKINPKTLLKIKLSFKRDHKGQLRIQARINNNDFHDLLKGLDYIKKIIPQ